MKAFDIVRRAGRSLRQAKVRTLLTSLAIAVGAFTIMLSLAAGEGARQYANELISSNVDPQGLFIVKDEAIVSGPQQSQALREYDPDVGSQNGQSIKLLNKKDLKKLQQRDDIEDVRPIYDVQATYLKIESFKKKYQSEINVFNPDLLLNQVAGDAPELGEDLRSGEVLVPESFAKVLKVQPEELVGNTITLRIERPAQLPDEDEIQKILLSEGPQGLAKLGRTESLDVKLKIRAVVQPPELSFTPSDALQLPQPQAKKIANFSTKGTNSYQKYFAVTAKAREGNDPEEVKAGIEKLGLFPQTANDLQGFLFTIVNVLMGIVAGFGAVALLASVFGIINTQYISVLERTQQIGLMKALGMRRRDVLSLFLVEAVWIGFLGGVIGAGIAWGLGTALNPWISETIGLSEGTYLLVFLPWHALALISGLMGVAALAGLMPARKASKLDPIAALRTE